MVDDLIGCLLITTTADWKKENSMRILKDKEDVKESLLGKIRPLILICMDVLGFTVLVEIEGCFEFHHIASEELEVFVFKRLYYLTRMM